MRNLTIKSIRAVLVLGVTMTFAQQKGDSFESAKKSKSANIFYIHAGVEGFASSNANGTTGLLVDVMSEFENFLSQKYGIVVSGTYIEAQNKDFKIYLQEVKSSTGGVFGLSNTSVKEERKAFLKFSPSFLNNVSVLVSHESFPKLLSLGEISTVFSSRTGYGVPSTTNYERLMNLKSKYFPKLRVVDVPSSIRKNVANDVNGFGFTDIYYYLEDIEQGKPVKRHAVGDQKGDEFAIIMPLTSDWDTAMAEFLSVFLKTADYREIVTKHLGKGALRMIVN